ncbi:MAG TPA: hypothetical protein ENK41_01760 [Rhodobacteraceae bacterium]|nr:hypothetical protein [Paracoccaceae bacterium]
MTSPERNGSGGNGSGGKAASENAALFGAGPNGDPAEDAPPQTGGDRRTGPSMFIGRRGGGLFAPYAPRVRRIPERGAGLPGARPGSGPVAGLEAVLFTGPVARNVPQAQVQRIRALIGQAEAGARGYDAVNMGAKIRPPKAPTRMRIEEIYDWIAATPGQPHAIGYYQFIPATLKRLVTRLGLPPDTLFTPAVQDRLGDLLLEDAGLLAFRAGEIDRVTFMNNLSKVWAGLPYMTGKSYYDGIAGNRASLTWEYFDREMARIFPG